MGSPVYTAAGDVVGVLVIQTTDAEEGEFHPASMLSRMAAVGSCIRWLGLLGWSSDPSVAEPSMDEGTFSGVSAGGFDMQGAYYVVNMRGHNILRVDPWKGTILETMKMPSSAGYNGVAFIGERFYAARGGTGDPPQEFGAIDLKTGEFTPIGYTNVGVNGKGGGNGCGALDYDQAARTLFLVYRQGIEQGQGWSLYTVDLTTGQATFVDELRPKAVYDAFAVRG
jgi:hypothetical protein